MKNLNILFSALPLLAVSLAPAFAQKRAVPQPEALFFEAENFQVKGGGWKVKQAHETRPASQVKTLNGASGNMDSTATQVVDIPEAGTWRIWVRYMAFSAARGPFTVDVMDGMNVVASRVFDEKPKEGVTDWTYVWDSFDATLKAGKHSLILRKHKEKEVTWYARNVDCVLLTQDLKQEPDHIPYGPQTWMRVTLGQGYEKPVQVHIFADHYRDPWYEHYAISKDGLEPGLNPSRQEALLNNGESTGWVNITRTIYQDSGALLTVYPAYAYGAPAARFNATVEFTNRPRAKAVARKFEVDSEPSSFHLAVPPNLETAENIALLRSDLEIANEYGAIADKLAWPKAGKAPVKFPFIVPAQFSPSTLDHRVMARELKTLSYFGFNGIGYESIYAANGFPRKYIGGPGWFTKGSYSAPDTEKIRESAAIEHNAMVAAGVKADEIDFAMVMDEPTGEEASFLATDAASIEGFRTWLKSKNLTPEALLVASWDDVKPVPETERDKFPALHYYTQQYRTVALGNFIGLHKQLLHEQWKADFPVNVNFSDGAVYYANFYGQGVDYFTLLHDTPQNAIWSEDWSNGASTYQSASFNVDLMRSAARKNGQHLGHYLIAYASRKPYDIRLKAVSEVARGVKAFKTFAYGPVWATHEGSPWQKTPQMWLDHAAAVREIGAVEDMLLPAQPRAAEVALLYSSAADIWTAKTSSATGFDRMHTWLALSHAQVPVDIVHESDAASGQLSTYKVCYFSDPNITRAAALKLRDWVQAGGTLVLAAGAGQFDEYNRPLDILDKLLPYQRNPLQILQPYQASGYYIPTLNPLDTVTVGQTKMDVLSVKQTFAGIPADGVTIEGTFADGSPAALRSKAGKGQVVSRGFLPALDYIRKALIAKNGIEQRKQELRDNKGIPAPEDAVLLESNEKSYNPWEYPAGVRDAILEPTRSANIDLPIVCNVPLVDAVYMKAPQGVLIPLANYTLKPIPTLTLDIAVERPVREVRSVYQGILKFQKMSDKKIRLSLPLDCTDFLTIQ